MLREQTGRLLITEGDLANQLVLIAVRDMPLPKLKERLSRALVGSWVPVGNAGGLKLTRDDRAKLDFCARAFAAQIPLRERLHPGVIPTPEYCQDVASSLAKLFPPITKTGGPIGWSPDAYAAMDALPGARLEASLLKMIPLDELRKSVKASSFAHLDGDPKVALRSYVVEREMWRNALNRTPLPPEMDDGMRSRFAGLLKLGPNASELTVKVELSGLSWGTRTVTIHISDNSGESVEQLRESAYQPWQDERVASMPGLDDRFELSPESVAFIRRFHTGSMHPSPPLTELADNPDSIYELSPAQIWLKYAEKFRINVVAAVSDSSLPIGGPFNEHQMRDLDLCVRNLYGGALTEFDGEIVTLGLWPSVPMDRSNLIRCLRKVRASPLLPLDDWLDVVRSFGQGQLFTFSRLAQWVSPGFIWGEERVHRDLLGVYARLSPTVIAKLARGPVPVTALSEKERSMLNALQLNEQSRRSKSDFRRAPLADGDTITLRQEHQPCIITPYYCPLDANFFANEARWDTAAGDRDSSSNSNPEMGRLGDQESLYLDFQTSGKKVPVLLGDFYRYDPKSKVLRYSEFPPEFVAKIIEARQLRSGG